MTDLLLELTTLLTFWLCLAAWQRDRTARGRRLFMALCAGVFTWSAGNLVGSLGHLSEQEALRLSWLGVLVLAPVWLALGLVMRGARVAEKAPWGLALLLAPGCALYVLLFQEQELASLFLVRDGQGVVRMGPLGWLYAGYAWSLSAAGSIHVGLSARRLRSRGAQTRRVVLAISSAVPLVANTVFVLTGVPGIDPTPMLLGALLVALRSELFSGDLLQALPVSQHDLVSQLPTPLILTDPGGRVTEINPAAQNCLGIAKADALDRNIEALLESAAFAPEFDRWSLVASGREADTILLRALPKREEERR